MSRMTEAYYPSAASRAKKTDGLLLQEEISRAVSCSNAIAIQEQGWSKRSEEPYGPLYDGWVEELQQSAKRASDRSFQLDCYDIASKLHVDPKFNGDIVYGIIDGQNVKIETTYTLNPDYYHDVYYSGEVDGEPLGEEEAELLWKNVGWRTVYLENTVLKGY